MLQHQCAQGGTAAPTEQNRIAFAWLLLPLLALLIALFVLAVAPLWVPDARPPVDASLFLFKSLRFCNPKPREQLCTTFCLVGVPIVAWLAMLLVRKQIAQGESRLGAPMMWFLVLCQLAAAGFLIAMWRYQNQWIRVFFSWSDLARGAALAAGTCLVWVCRRSRAGREIITSRAAGIAAFLAALLFVALRMKVQWFADRDLFRAPELMQDHFPWTAPEFTAPLHGRTVLVDFFPQYFKLLGYALIPWFRLVGFSVSTYTGGIAALATAGVMLQWDLLRRVTGSAVMAIALFIPYAAVASATLSNGYYPLTLRSLGPWLIAWLLAIYLQRPTRARMLRLFFVGALAALNNLDFGLPALAGAGAAILLTGNRDILPSLSWLARTAGGALLSAGLAIAGFMGFTVLRSHRWPRMGELAGWQRIYVIDGFANIAMPRYGFQWIVYATFVASIVAALAGMVAAGRIDAAASSNHHAPNPRMLAPAMLLYAAIAATGPMAYYGYRSEQTVLTATLPPWTFMVVLLAWMAFRDPAALMRMEHPARWLLRAIPAAAVAVLYLACLSSAATVPRQHLADCTVDCLAMSVYRAWGGRIAEFTVPGEKVFVDLPCNPELCAAAGVDNYYPFTFYDAAITTHQLDLAMQCLAASGATTLIGRFTEEFQLRFYALGYTVAVEDPDWDITVWKRRGDPNDEPSTRRKGMLYARLHQFAQARRCYARAIAMDPSDRQAIRELANLLAQRGDEWGAADSRRRLQK